MGPAPIYSPAHRMYYATFVDGLDIDYPVSREVLTMQPYVEVNFRPTAAQYPYFNFNRNLPNERRIAPWQANKLPDLVGDTSLNGALSWDGPFKRWIWCENVTGSAGNYTRVYQNDEFFTDQAQVLVAGIKQNPYHLVNLIGRISQPTASGVARQRLIWLEQPGNGPQFSNADQIIYSADMDGSNVRQEMRQSSTFSTSGGQTYRGIDSWTFHQEKGDIYVVVYESPSMNGNPQRTTRQLRKLAWDRAQQRYNNLFIYGTTWTASQNEPMGFIAQPTLSRSLDDAVIFPIYDAYSSNTPGNLGTFRSYNAIRIHSQSSLQQIGEIELPNPHGIIPDPTDPQYDESYAIGQSVAAWTSETTGSMYLWVGDNLGSVFPHNEDQWEGMYEMNLDGSNMRKMAQYATRRDAGVGTFVPSQNIFLGPGCYGAWECCT